MDPAPEPKTRRARIAAATLAAAALVGLGLYGGASWWSNRGGGCAADAATLARVDAASRGEVAAFQALRRAERLPPLSFREPDGSRTDLAALGGRTVLLNLWATWCEPCRREMPALDRLQSALGGDAFRVVAVNIDTRDPERARAWMRDVGVNRLPFYSDPEARIFQDLRRAGLAEGMPTTLLVDPAGCQIGHMAGPAEWASPDGLALIRAAFAR